MKKSLKIILLALTVVLFSLFALGCGSSEKESDVKDVNGENTQKASGVTVEEQTVYDRDGMKITVKSFDSDSCELNLLIENSGSENLTVQCDSLSVNGIMTDCIFSSSVAAGKKANDSIDLMKSDLKKAGISTVAVMEFKFTFFNTDTWDGHFESDIIKIVTSAGEDYEQKADDSGKVVVDRDGVKIIAKKLVDTDSFWGSDICIFIENSTDENLTVQARDVSVNGFMMEPVFSCEVAAGKKAFDSITFLESDLTENGIEDITDIELSFHVFYTDGFDTCFDSDTVNISF